MFALKKCCTFLYVCGVIKKCYQKMLDPNIRGKFVAQPPKSHVYGLCRYKKVWNY
uniref:Uncharacterized protein n=1 Tax=Lepeophtheirus salmonis TaxID=72036 RepID=A0A0K2U6N3_LEPSM